VVVELINEGRDRVETTLTSYLLGLYVDDLTFTGAGNFLGTGNSLDNSIVGGAGADVLKGEGGNDTLVGLGGVDTMWGGIGNDHYYVDDANDKVNEGKFDGTDSVFSSVTFTLSTYVENLTLLGGASINGFGNTIGNEIIGNAAANKLYGDFGNDTLTGNGGADEFIFNTSLNGTNNVDFITDFAVVDDTIVLDKAVFKALTAGALAAAAFHIGAGPADMSDRIIYDAATGNLYYDANGSAGGSSSGNGTQFAKLAAGLALTSADFLVV
jgi:Ca2+-binding RTX toxin-like protein